MHQLPVKIKRNIFKDENASFPAKILPMQNSKFIKNTNAHVYLLLIGLQYFQFLSSLRSIQGAPSNSLY